MSLYSALPGLCYIELERGQEAYWTSLARSLGSELLFQLVSGGGGNESVRALLTLVSSSIVCVTDSPGSCAAVFVLCLDNVTCSNSKH
jgi:hypothetical protein